MEDLEFFSRLGDDPTYRSLVAGLVEALKGFDDRAKEVTQAALKQYVDTKRKEWRAQFMDMTTPSEIVYSSSR